MLFLIGLLIFVGLLTDRILDRSSADALGILTGNIVRDIRDMCTGRPMILGGDKIVFPSQLHI